MVKKSKDKGQGLVKIMEACKRYNKLQKEKEKEKEKVTKRTRKKEKNDIQRLKK